VNCRAVPLRTEHPTAMQTLDRLDGLLGHVLRRQDAGASKTEIVARVLEAQQIAILGAAYERRRERGEA
jgi:hypothetical protein